jgi:hypothetical protein
MKYLLDMDTSLLFLASRKQSGELSTTLKRFPGVASKGPCQIFIALAEGKMLSSTVQDAVGTVLVDGRFVLAELQKMGQLDWTWLPTRQGNTPPPSFNPAAQKQPANGFSSIPRRTVPLERIERSTLPRKHWQVLMLVDGMRTVAQIAALLTPSPTAADMQGIIAILKELQHQGIIVADDI